MALFTAASAYAISKALIPSNAKAIGFTAESLDEQICSHVEIREMLANTFVVFARIFVEGSSGETPSRIMTTALGEVATYRTAGAAVEAVKLKTFDGADLAVYKLPRDATPTDKKGRVSRYKMKFAERIKALGNLAALQLRIDATPASDLKNELLERKDAVTGWVSSVGATVDALYDALALDGVDANTLVI